MPLFLPRTRMHRLTDIGTDFMRRHGLNAVLLDIDNTMAMHDDPEPHDGVREWIATMLSQGFKLIIVSNNSSKRVEDFANSLGLGFIGKARKPLPSGFRRACRELGVKAKTALVVGDQLFTDMLGGNLCGAYTVLTDPLGEHETDFIKFKRKLERPLLRRMSAREKRAK